MTAEKETHKVQDVGNWTFQVESWTKPELHHTVEMMEYMGNGACTCGDFMNRRIRKEK